MVHLIMVKCTLAQGLMTIYNVGLKIMYPLFIAKLLELVLLHMVGS